MAGHHCMYSVAYVGVKTHTFAPRLPFRVLMISRMIHRTRRVIPIYTWCHEASCFTMYHKCTMYTSILRAHVFGQNKET
jgi:hypothetical protein